MSSFSFAPLSNPNLRRSALKHQLNVIASSLRLRDVTDETTATEEVTPPVTRCPTKPGFVGFIMAMKASRCDLMSA